MRINHYVLCGFIFGLGGCATDNPAPPVLVPVTKLVYPKFDSAILTCPGEPSVPSDITTDAQEHAQWVEPMRQAGKACRNNLAAIKAYVDSWPK